MSDALNFRTEGKTDAGQSVDQFAAPPIGDSDLADHTAKMVANALEATRLIEIVEIHARPGQVHLLGRVKKDDERPFMDKVVWPALEVMWDEDIDGHVGKQFFLRNNKAQRKYGWVFSIANKDIRKAAQAICQSFASATKRFEVTEAPLQGPGTPVGSVNLGRGSGRRGASKIGG